MNKWIAVRATELDAPSAIEIISPYDYPIGLVAFHDEKAKSVRIKLEYIANEKMPAKAIIFDSDVTAMVTEGNHIQSIEIKNPKKLDADSLRQTIVDAFRTCKASLATKRSPIDEARYDIAEAAISRKSAELFAA